MDLASFILYSQHVDLSFSIFGRGLYSDIVRSGCSWEGETFGEFWDESGRNFLYASTTLFGALRLAEQHTEANAILETYLLDPPAGDHPPAGSDDQDIIPN